MKRTREKVRGLKWSIRLERLEDRFPLDGGLGAISEVQLQSIKFDYLQIQYGPWLNQASTSENPRLDNSSSMDFYVQGSTSAHQFSNGVSVVEKDTGDNSYHEISIIETRWHSLTLDVNSDDAGNVPIPNPIMISLPVPIGLIAIAERKDQINATSIREVSQIVELQDSKAIEKIERTPNIREPNQPTLDSRQRDLKSVSNNTMVLNHAMGERSPASSESSINVPLENVASTDLEPTPQAGEFHANRISWDTYYKKTEATHSRQELRWSTDELASATRQQVISESSALLAIIASKTSKSSRSNNQSDRDADFEALEPKVRLVSHFSQFEPRTIGLEPELNTFSDYSKGQSQGSADSRANVSSTEGQEHVYSNWGTYVLALAGLTLSLASTEAKDNSTLPELLKSRNSGPFPFGKGSV